MTNYWDLSNEEQAKIDALGIDYSLRACLEYNPQNFTIFDIDKVMAVWEGENDRDDWRWVIRVKKDCSKTNGGRYVFLQGGCDYTGWDCQSWATSQFTKTALKAAHLALGDVQVGESHPYQAGLGHMLNILGGTYDENFQKVYDSLVEQIKSSKKKTWRENKDEELNTKDLPKISYEKIK
jgi:hypothetical protein